MEYNIIQPPFTLEFRAMGREEAIRYFNWFMEQIPIRIRVLEQAIKSTVEYENWKADYIPGSLERLGQWFYEHVETRKRTEEEKVTIYSGAPNWFRNVDIPEWELTNLTFSLAMDVGMYFSQVLQKNIPGLKWIMIRKPKNHIDFQQPVIAGIGNNELNPVRLVVVYAYALADNTHGPERLKELYSIWASLLLK